VRAADGQRARAGDVLQALCWSVTGAFRKIGASTYLLSDDVQGIGTRWARLAEWAEAADLARSNAMQELLDAVAKRDPLSHLRFAPGDPYDAFVRTTRRVDAAYRKERYTPRARVQTVRTVAGPATLRGAVCSAPARKRRRVGCAPTGCTSARNC
jgi:hypothetical protein